MKTKFVTLTEDISSITNETFIFNTEIAKGFIKRDLTPLNTTDYTLENVLSIIEGLDLDTMLSIKLDSVLFVNGEERISSKIQKWVETEVEKKEPAMKQAWFDSIPQIKNYIDVTKIKISKPVASIKDAYFDYEAKALKGAIVNGIEYHFDGTYWRDENEVIWRYEDVQDKPYLDMYRYDTPKTSSHPETRSATIGRPSSMPQKSWWYKDSYGSSRHQSADSWNGQYAVVLYNKTVDVNTLIDGYQTKTYYGEEVIRTSLIRGSVTVNYQSGPLTLNWIAVKLYIKFYYIPKGGKYHPTINTKYIAQLPL